jgi:hypothetical protein
MNKENLHWYLIMLYYTCDEQYYVGFFFVNEEFPLTHISLVYFVNALIVDH